MVGPALRGSAPRPPRSWVGARGSQRAAWTVSRNRSPEDEVDLGRRRPRRRIEGEHDDVDDAVGHLDLGPLVALEDVLGDERVEAERARRSARPARATGSVRSIHDASRPGRPSAGAPAVGAVDLATRRRDRPCTSGRRTAIRAARPVVGARDGSGRAVGPRPAARSRARRRSARSAAIAAPPRTLARRAVGAVPPRPPAYAPRRPPRASAAGSRRAVSTAATQEQPDHDPRRLAGGPASRARRRRAPSCSGRSRRSSGMNCLYASGVA